MKKPNFDKPADIHAFFSNVFGACGCSELEEMIDVIKIYLKWLSTQQQERENWDHLFINGHIGTYYIIMGVFDNADLCEHGTSIRHPWITDKGKALLDELTKYAVEEITYGNDE